MSDPTQALVYEDGEAHCPNGDCEWRIHEDADEAFYNHYYEHTDLARKFSEFKTRVGEREDIDVMHADVDFRCEKMSESHVFLAAYDYENQDGDALDIKYRFLTEGDQIVITRRINVD